MLRDARALRGDETRLHVEALASGWLGRAWQEAGLGERHPERALVGALADRLTGGQGPAAAVALAAVRTVLTAEDQQLADVGLGGEPAPSWAGAVEWTATGAWRGTDVYEAERVLVVGYDGPEPHDLLVRVSTTGGLVVEEILLTEPGLRDRWNELAGDLRLAELDPPTVLTEIADALWTTDMYWPRVAEAGFVGLRALAHARSRPWKVQTEWTPLPDERRGELLDAFVAEAGLDLPVDSVRLLADLFLDFGDGYLVAGPLAWSPGEVERFLLDWVPRKAVLDAEDRELLPTVLRAWVAFALHRLGRADDADISRVVAVVDELREEFAEAYDDDAAWGPGRQVLAALQERGVDLTDREAVADAVRAYNAEQLARRLAQDAPGDA